MSSKVTGMPSGFGKMLWGGMLVFAALAHALPPDKLRAAYSRPADVISAEATVVDVSIDRRVSGGRRSRVKYDCEVRAQYQAGGLGRTVTATITRSSRSDAESACAEFQPGFKHEVFYSRSDPSNASLRTGYFGVPVWTSIMLGLGPLGLFLLWRGRKQMRNYKRRYGSYRAV